MTRAVLPQKDDSSAEPSSVSFRASRLARLHVSAILLSFIAVAPAHAQTPAFVQGSYQTPQSAQTSVAVTFSSLQTAGNLNVVIVGWNDTTAQVQTVTDSRGNTYARAVGPTVRNGLGTQSIYYAANITAGANTITVTFVPAAQNADVRIAEYRGIAAANPLDVAVGATGSSSTSSSGSVTTTNANDLLVGGNLVGQHTTGAGTGYTSRMITTPDGDILEDRTVTATGSYDATARLTGGPWVMQMAAFRAASATPDTQPPTAPTGLAATASTSSQIALTWTASTDNIAVNGYQIQRCQGAGCSNFAQIATSAGATYNDTTVAGSNTYSYRVRATDAAGNVSAYSSTATATTPGVSDTQAPTDPSGLAVSSVSSTQVDLSWTASTDNVGVTNYLIERCQGSGCLGFTQIGVAATPGYTDPGLSGSTSYRYRVRATDAAGNVSGYSGVVDVTTSPSSARLVQHAGRDAGTVVSTSLAFPSANTAGNWIGVAIRAGNSGQTFTVTDSRGNTYRKAAQLNETVDGTSLALYYAETIAAGANTVTVASSISGGTLRIAILEYAGIAGSSSLDAVAVDQGTSAAPNSGSAQSATSGDLVIGVISSANGATFTPGAGFVAEELVPQSGSKLLVEDRVQPAGGAVSASSNLAATDNWGALVATFRVTTIGPDTQPPTAPAGLTATAGASNQIGLTWTASSDNVGVTSYFIERCQGAGCATFAQVGASTAASYADNGVNPSTAYGYRVRATDAANNLSTYSNTASATTAVSSDTQAPTAPNALTATVVSSAQVGLSWTASTDNVGVTGYMIERCQGSGCSTFTQVATVTATTYTDNGVTQATSYSYRVRATDAASNLSGYSNIANAITPAAPSIAFVQQNYATPQVALASVSVTYTGAQTPGNLNIVIVGWNDTTAQVQTVTDTRGNTYLKAVGPTVRAGFATQSIYYASNITGAVAGGNRVTVTFSPAATNADIRIAEYRGIDAANPVDAVVAGSGSSTNSSSGSVTTSNANDLLVGANMVASQTLGAGPGFTNRVITTPDGDILEDRIVAAAGSYTATAPTNGGAWIMQMVAFRAGGSPVDAQPPAPPTGLTATTQSATQIGLTWTASTDNVGVTSYLVERCQGQGCAAFAQVTSVSPTTFADSGLTTNTTYSYRVRATDAAGNLSGYSNVASATTTTQPPDSEPPSAPGTLTATAVSGTQVNLSWGPASDNVGVTGYRVERCQGVGCSVFVKLATPSGTTFADTGLTPNTTYTYIVLATDAAGNLGPYSNPAGVTTGSTVPELVASFSFNEGTGSTVTDVSGTGNHGTIKGAAWTTAGKFGGALTFNGTARVVVTDSPSLHLTSAVTLEAWVRPTNVSSGWRDVIYKGNDNYYLEVTTQNGGTPAAGVTLSQSGNSNAYGPSALPANTWTHLAETFDGSTLRLYVNGVQAASTPLSGTLVTSTNPLEIGGDSIFGQYFQGTIDEVRVYNVARTPAQIQSDMNAPVGSAVPIVSLSSASLDFGRQAIGMASAEQNVTLTNLGGAQLNISGITVIGSNAADFAQTSSCGGSLAAGSSCTVRVRFTPSAAGSETAAVSIQDDAAGAPHMISLQGTGVSVLVTPAVATLTPGTQQQFTATSSGGASFIWSVDGVTGGSVETGTISTAGLYTAGATGTHTITATSSDLQQSGSATIFVVSYTGTFTFHNDNARTGANLDETVLKPSTVTSARFGKLRSYAIDGVAYASPLYVPGVTIPGQGVFNVVYVATEHDSVYAFDADGGSASPLWTVSFINPAAGVTTVSPSDTLECCDITPEIGITGTPVIDPLTNTLYVVAKTKESSNYVQRLHALDIATGAEKFGGPVVIQGSVTGTGSGATGNRVDFVPLRQNQRPALLLNNGVVYVAFGSHGDHQPYHGWIFGYNASTLQQTLVYNATPNGEGAGIWLANAGLAADTAGLIYFSTGDGTFSADTGGTDYGDSYVKMDSTGRVVDYFTPHNEGELDNSNSDLGSGGVLLLPDQPGTHPHLLVSAGKNGTIDLIDRDNMGHFNPNSDGQIVQTLPDIFPFGTPEPGNYSSPVYFAGTVYFSPVADSIQAFRLTNGRFSTTPTSRSAQIFGYPGGTLALSASGTTNGILWALERRSNSSGALRAYDATNLAIELYNSDQAGSRDVLDEVVKFNAPLIANGKVYVASATRFTIFGPIQ